MGKRLDLHNLLCGALGSENVYYEPPENVKMVYPCIVYERTKIDARYADGIPYLRKKKYTLTAIYRDPDSEIADRLFELPTCMHDRFFKTDSLYHDVFTIYF